MTHAELVAVESNAGSYTKEEVEASQREHERLDKALTDELTLIGDEALALVDELNDVDIDPAEFRAKVEDFTAAQGRRHPPHRAGDRSPDPEEGPRRQGEGAPDATHPTQVLVVESLMKSGGSRVTGNDPDPGQLQARILSNPIKFPGAKDVVSYVAPTDESKKHVADKGIDALRVPGALGDSQLHWVVNALIAADADEPGTSAGWFALLDFAAPCWPAVKAGSAKDWIKHALLIKGKAAGSHYRGMFGEQVAAIEFIESGDLAKGTQLTLGKHKARERVPALKKNTPATQDVDISFHHRSGERYYVEVKADPQTIVNKIGVDEDKSKDGVVNDLLVADRTLLTTPDQVLSYQSTKVTHEAKPTSKHYKPGMKRIVLIYASRVTTRWLLIFTSKAARRLVKHDFHLQLGPCVMDAGMMTAVQTKVDLAIKGLSEPEIDDWVTTTSLTAPDKFL